jgi:hypothetical protein
MEVSVQIHATTSSLQGTKLPDSPACEAGDARVICGRSAEQMNRLP